jgi:hypothetical protein
VRLNEVHTTREADFLWALLSEVEGDAVSKDDRIVFVREACIERIEICFRPSDDWTVGFLSPENSRTPHEQRRIVELALVGEHVAGCVRGHG